MFVALLGDATERTLYVALLDQECFPSLEAAELAEEIDGTAATDAEQLFDAGAIDDWCVDGLELSLNSWKLK